MPQTLPPDSPQFTEYGNIVVLAGHGMLLRSQNVEAGRQSFNAALGEGQMPDLEPVELSFRLPEGASITVWCKTQRLADEHLPPAHVRAAEAYQLDNDVGMLIEEGSFGAAYQRVHVSTAQNGQQLPLTFEGGEVVPNLMLLPPRTLTQGAPRHQGMVVCGLFTRAAALSAAVRLLHGPGRTTHFHWAACSELLRPTWHAMHRDPFEGRGLAELGGVGDVFKIARRYYARIEGEALPAPAAN